MSSKISSPHVGHGIRGSLVRFLNFRTSTLCTDDGLSSILAECMEALTDDDRRLRATDQRMQAVSNKRRAARGGRRAKNDDEDWGREG